VSLKGRLDRVQRALLPVPGVRCDVCADWPDPRLVWELDDRRESTSPAVCPVCGWRPELSIIVHEDAAAHARSRFEASAE
jgi:hypothetical protein